MRRLKKRSLLFLGFSVWVKGQPCLDAASYSSFPMFVNERGNNGNVSLTEESKPLGLCGLIVSLEAFTCLLET